MKKIIVLFISIMMCFSVACSTSVKDQSPSKYNADKLSKNETNKKSDLVVLLKSCDACFDANLSNSFPLSFLNDEFEKKTGYKVTFEKVLDKKNGDFEKNFNSKLLAGDVPALVCLEDTLSNTHNLSNSGAFENLTFIKGHDDISLFFRGNNYIIPAAKTSVFFSFKDDNKEFESKPYNENDWYSLFKSLNNNSKIPLCQYTYDTLLNQYIDVTYSTSNSDIHISFEDLNSHASEIRAEIFKSFQFDDDLTEINYNEYITSDGSKNLKFADIFNQRIDTGELKKLSIPYKLWRLSDSSVRFLSRYAVPINNDSFYYESTSIKNLDSNLALNKNPHVLPLLVPKSAPENKKKIAYEYIEFLISKQNQQLFFDKLFETFETGNVAIENFHGYGPTSKAISDYSKKHLSKFNAFSFYDDRISEIFNLTNNENWCEKNSPTNIDFLIDELIKNDIKPVLNKFVFNFGQFTDEELKADLNKFLNDLNLKINEMELVNSNL